MCVRAARSPLVTARSLQLAQSLPHTTERLLPRVRPADCFKSMPRFTNGKTKFRGQHRKGRTELSTAVRWRPAAGVRTTPSWRQRLTCRRPLAAIPGSSWLPLSPARPPERRGLLSTSGRVPTQRPFPPPIRLLRPFTRNQSELGKLVNPKPRPAPQHSQSYLGTPAT